MNHPSFNDIKQIVSGHWQHILEINMLDTTINFFALGGNSIQAMELTGLLNETFHLDLTLADFFDTLTIDKITTLIVHQLRLCA